MFVCWRPPPTNRPILSRVSRCPRRIKRWYCHQSVAFLTKIPSIGIPSQNHQYLTTKNVHWLYLVERNAVDLGPKFFSCYIYKHNYVLLCLLLQTLLLLLKTIDSLDNQLKSAIRQYLDSAVIKAAIDRVQQVVRLRFYILIWKSTRDSAIA